MKEWKDERLTDEEFIRGIYEKADKLRENSSEMTIDSHIVVKNHRKLNHRIVSGVCIAASFTAVLTGTITYSKYMLRARSSARPDNVVYRAIEEPEDYEDNKHLTVPDEEEPIQVIGTINSFEESDDNIILSIHVERSDDKEIPDNLHIVVSEELYEQLCSYEEEQGIDGLEGESVLLYLESYNWQEYYKVNNDDGLYLRNKTEEDAIYENMDGDQMEESQIIW